MVLTRDEIGRLARAARGWGLYVVGPGHASYPCPVAVEALRAAHSRNVPHRFEVCVDAPGSATDLDAIAAALLAHLAAANTAGEPCDRVLP